MARKFECLKCGKKFRTESGLKWHLYHIHSESEGKLKSHRKATIGDLEDEKEISPSKIKYPIHPVHVFYGTPEWRKRLMEEKDYLLYEVLPKMEKEGKSYFEKKPIYNRLDKIFNELNQGSP